jgi:hypothetical protein
MKGGVLRSREILTFSFKAISEKLSVGNIQKERFMLLNTYNLEKKIFLNLYISH